VEVKNLSTLGKNARGAKKQTPPILKIWDGSKPDLSHIQFRLSKYVFEILVICKDIAYIPKKIVSLEHAQWQQALNHVSDS
jgi:hypothetical protein